VSFDRVISQTTDSHVTTRSQRHYESDKSHSAEKYCEPLTILIHFLGQLQGFGRRKISVGCRHGKDDRVGVADIPQTHLSDLDFNIVRLIADGDLRDAGQVNQRQG